MASGLSKLMRRLSVLVVVALPLLAALSFFGVPVPARAAEAGQNVLINVVYDDSGSMVYENDAYITRWSQAKYAMEVFCAMMDEGDVMNVYPMSSEGALGLTLDGGDSSRVGKVHEMSASYNNTPFSTVEGAIAGLRSADQVYERWLVVLTDGAFEDGATPMSEVQAALDSCNAEGIKTVFLGVGNIEVPEAHEAQGGYVFTASDGGEVLDRVASIANQVFSRQLLSSDYVSSAGRTTTLSLDIPISQLIVFAQGEDVSVGSLSVNGVQIEPTSVQQVSYSSPSTVLNYRNPVADTSLRGVLVTFEAGEKPFESGSYSLDVTGARTTGFYYSPGVTVNCDLLYQGVTVGSDDELYSGTYDARLSYVNPLTGEELTSALLPTDGMSLTVTNNGEARDFDGQESSFDLTQGEVTLLASAQLPGNVFLTSSKTYHVLPDPIDLNVSYDEVPPYALSDLGSNPGPIVVSVTEGAEGAPLSEGAWQGAELVVAASAGVEWSVERGGETGAWNLVPRVTDEDALWAAGCVLRPDVEVSYQVGDQYAYGVGSAEVPVEVSLLDVVRRNLWLILALLVLAIVILGETVFKRRFRIPRRANPTCTNKKDRKVMPHEYRRIVKNLWSVVIPFVAERATVLCSDSSENCNFPNMKIKATRRGRFKILNYEALAQGNTIIDGVQYRDKDELEGLRKREFGFAGFELASVDRTGKTIGVFSIN